MEFSVEEELAAIAIGREVLAYTKQQDLARQVECEAAALLEDILRILNNEVLDDPACFHRIEELVLAFRCHGLYTSRHDFG